jgi:hypothetical protein
MKTRQYRSRQGRSDEKYEESGAILFYTMSAAFIILLTYSIIKYAI